MYFPKENKLAACQSSRSLKVDHGKYTEIKNTNTNKLYTEVIFKINIYFR